MTLPRYQKVLSLGAETGNLLGLGRSLLRLLQYLDDWEPIIRNLFGNSNDLSKSSVSYLLNSINLGFVTII